jgi:integrase
MYYAVWYDPETRKRIWCPLGTSRQREADQLRVKQYRAYVAERFHPERGWRQKREAVAFDMARDAYLDDLRKSGRTDKSIKDMTSYFKTLVAFQEDPPGRVDLELARRMKALYQRETLAPASRHSYYRRSKAFLNWCAQRKLCSRRLAELLPAPKKRRRIPMFIEVKDLQRIIARAERDHPLMGPIVRLGYSTGLRLSELLALQWEHVGDTHLRVRGKGDHERLVPIFPEAERTLERLSPLSDYVVSDRRYTGDYISKCFKRIVREEGLSETIHFHSLRHTFASYLAMDAVPLDRIRDWMGHESIVTTEIYAHLAPEGATPRGVVVFPHLTVEDADG